MIPTRAPTKVFSACRQSLATSGSGSWMSFMLMSARADATSTAAEELRPAPIGTSPCTSRLAP